MRVFGHHHHRCDDPYAEAPIWALELAVIMGLILENQETIMATNAEIKTKLDALTADVAEETNVIAGMETLLSNLSEIIAKLKLDATNAQVDPAIVDQIDALGQAVSANKTRIAKDVTDNTPAA